MEIHELKCWPSYFRAVKAGDKTFEVRKDDRDGYDLHDYLLLQEWRPSADSPGTYTGDSLMCRVTYVLHDDIPGVADGYVVLGIKVLS